jgi:predicted MFS family arabinose efflux permease
MKGLAHLLRVAVSPLSVTTKCGTPAKIASSVAASEAASAVNVTNLQIALAAGAGIAAILVSSTSLQTVFLTAGLIVLASAVLAAMATRLVTLARRE